MGSALSIEGLPHEQLNDLGTRQCREFRRNIFKRHMWLGMPLMRRYRAVARSVGYIEANRMLLEFEKRVKLGGTGLFADVDDQAICDYAEAKSKQMEKEFYDFTERCGRDLAIEYIEQKCEQAGVGFPLVLSKSDLENEDKKKEKTISALARVFDPLWWRRRLRAMSARTVERTLREWGFVSRVAGMYCSDHALTRRREQKSRTADLLEGMEAENQFGYRAGLDELAAAGMANPENRRAELMVRIRGFEEVAQALEHGAVFYTLTAPSKYHAVGNNGRRNEKFSGADPREASDYLNGVWQRVRAEWHREKIKPYGFRIAEPHHDGTPHWHLLLFVEKDKQQRATEIFRRHALVVDGNEEGAQKYRFAAVDIDWSRGSAAGYIAKYVAKNISGHAHDMAGDFDIEGGGTLQDNAERVEAWAATWGIRQFQQIGSVSVTAWREIRRRDAEKVAVSLTVGELAIIKQACDRADWAEYVRLMGGPTVARKDLTVRALAVLSDSENKYGEYFGVVRGIIMRGTGAVITRHLEWKIRKKRIFR